MGSEIKELLNVLGDFVAKAPDHVLYVLGGFAVFKIVVFMSTTGTIYGLGRLLILKIHDWGTREKPVPEIVTKVDSKWKFSGVDETEIWKPFREAKLYYAGKDPSCFASNRSDYIHLEHVEFVREAVKEKITRERDA